MARLRRPKRVFGMHVVIDQDPVRLRAAVSWKVLAAALLVGISVYWSGQAVLQTIRWASTVLLLQTIPFRLIAAIGPMLLLYSSVTCGLAILQSLRGNGLAAARMAWESVAWAGVGAAVTAIRLQPHIALDAALILAAAVLLEPRPRWQRRIARLSLETLALLAGIGFVLPLLWMIAASLRLPGLPQPTSLEWWPATASAANYPRLMQLLPLGHYLRNSLFVAGVGVPASLVVAAGAAFALLHLPERLRRGVLLLSSFGLAIPPSALWLTRFLLFRWFGVLNTPLVLLYPVLLGGSPVCVMLLYLAFRRIPTELWDQGRVDGADALQLWWRIGLPQVTGMIWAAGALIFGLFWGNFTDPQMYLSDRAWQTLPVGLQALQQLTRADWPVLMAGAVVMALPAVLVFAVAQGALTDLKLHSVDTRTPS